MKNLLYKIYYLFLLECLHFQITYFQDKINSINKNISNQKEQKLNIVNEFYGTYTKLYVKFRNKIRIYSNDNKYNNYLYNGNKENNIMLCTLGKEENLYAKEFVEYYFSLGFDKIVILDNNDLTGERFEDILNDFIKIKKVEILNIRGLRQVQIPSYNYCYTKYKYLYDWIAFFDFDEFLTIKNNYPIKKYLYMNNFKKCQLILFNSHIYDDNNLTKYDNRSMLDRFTHLKEISDRTKFIVRGNIKNLLITSAHIAINVNYCNSKGELIFPKSYYKLPKENYPFSYLKHFYTKTAEEYCIKRKRGYAQSRNKIFKKLLQNEINLFFKYNKKTPEKIKIFEKCNNVL